MTLLTLKQAKSPSTDELGCDFIGCEYLKLINCITLVIILATWKLLRTRVPGQSLEACQVVLGGTTGGLLECLRGWVFLKPTLPHHHLHTAVTEMLCSGIRRRVSLRLLYHYMQLQLIPLSCDFFLILTVAAGKIFIAQP